IEGLNFLVKRAFDFVVASMLLLAASPVLILAAVAVWLEDGRPIFFRQKRVGMHGEPFDFIKLRTMRATNSDTQHRDYVKKWIRDGDAAALNGEANGNGNEKANGNGNGNGNGKVFKIVNDKRI